MLQRFFRDRTREESADRLYQCAVAQGRSPWFYAECSVPDNVDGRFEMIALHVFLLLHRIKQPDIADDKLGQAVFDAMFLDMDRSLREMGAGDLGVGKRVKAMAKSFYGRIAAYESGLSDPSALTDAVIRNVFRGEEAQRDSAGRLAGYIATQVRHLSAATAEKIISGTVSFTEED